MGSVATEDWQPEEMALEDEVLGRFSIKARVRFFPPSSAGVTAAAAVANQAMPRSVESAAAEFSF